MWTLEQAVEFCRKAEPIAIAQGFHVALGGSVLIRGSSEKDLDIFVYPHKTVDGIALICVMDALREIGVSEFQRADHSSYGDEKSVYWTQFEGKRIDWFFVR